VEAGRHAAQLLPSDDSGYRIQPKDCEFLVSHLIKSKPGHTVKLPLA